MKASKLKVGDRIRILGFPDTRKTPFDLDPGTRRVYQQLLARKRPVRITEVDEFGPWLECNFRRKDGTLENHSLIVTDDDNNWVKCSPTARRHRKMKVSELKVGDRIRLLDIPGKGRAGYYMHPETRRVYERLLARKRPVRISKIDKTGRPWFECRFRRKNGRIEYHFLIVADDDNNWVKVR